MDACRFFGCTPDYWEDNLTMERLAAMFRSFTQRPPLESFAAGYFNYEPPILFGSDVPEMPTEQAPLYLP